jgi:hypothetical protein
MFDELDDWDGRIGFVGTECVRVQKLEDAKLVSFVIAITDRLDNNITIFAKTLISDQYSAHNTYVEY